MKLLIVLCLVAVVLGDKDAKISNYQFKMHPDGSYESYVKTANGIIKQEDGISYDGAEPESGNYVKTGMYSYEWEGVTYTVTWLADENGFHATGDHLPK